MFYLIWIEDKVRNSTRLILGNYRARKSMRDDIVRVEGHGSCSVS